MVRTLGPTHLFHASNLSDRLYLSALFAAGRENAVASTKAFTTQVTVLALIVSWCGCVAFVSYRDLCSIIVYFP